jgi:hypothetical protein
VLPKTASQIEEEIYDYENPTAVKKRFSDF